MPRRFAHRGIATFVPLASAEDGLLAWDGFYRGDDAGNGLVALFRNRASDARTACPLPASAHGRLVLRDVLGGGEIRMECDDLRAGLLPPISEDASCALFELRADG